MPMYNYICKDCGVRFEKFVSFSQDPDRSECPQGHKQVRRVFTPPVVVFKGSGFYINDSRPRKKSEATSE